MKRLFAIVLLMLIITIATTPLATQNNTCTPKSYPVRVPFKVINSIYYWKIESVSCIEKSKGGYKFRIKGVGKYDSSELSGIVPKEETK